MEDFKPSDRRNVLAIIRTQLANERTLMSYYRSAMALLGLSAFVFKFYSHPVFYIISGIFLILAIVMAVYGITRYYKFKKKVLRR